MSKLFKNVFLALILFVLLGTGTAGAVVSGLPKEEFSEADYVYRFWSDVFHGHFFTIDYDEATKVKNTDPNCKYEKVAFYAFPLSYTGNLETETVYRFWSPVFSHHFYTSVENEMNKVKNTDPNWTYEGPAFKVPKSQ